MITFKEYLNEIAIKGKAYKKKKVTEAELRELINTENKNKELENLDVSDITNMSGLFEATDYGKWEISDIDDWNTSNVLNMKDMFYGCNYLKESPKFNTSNVVNMKSMFNGCSMLSTFTLNTSKVEDARWMFRDCLELTKAPEFNSSSLKDCSCMFWGCENMTEGDMSNWDVSNIEDNKDMFHNCPFPEDKKPKFKD